MSAIGGSIGGNVDRIDQPVQAAGRRMAADVTARDRALDVLCSAELDAVVDMVLFSPQPNVYEARCHGGSVRFRRLGHRPPWRFELDAVSGRDPLAEQDVTRFGNLAEELAKLHPDRQANSYPRAFERIAPLFDHPCAPDLYVLHSAAHRWESHLGEHGSLDVVQSRAPFIVSGAGVRRLGLVDGHCTMVDVAPTLLRLLGLGSGTGAEPSLAVQDGAPVETVLDDGAAPAEHVVVVLMDGANANVCYAAAADGGAPNLARLIGDGTALAHGVLASLPTVTLPNHTTLLTGAHPGHHGVLHNAWYDRERGERIVTEAPDKWHEAMRWLTDGVETVHEAVKRYEPGALTVSVNEPADRGADFSTFDFFRRGEVERLADGVAQPPRHADTGWMASSSAYRWGSLVDGSALHQATSIWSGSYQGVEYGLPRFTWVSFSLTDAAFHEGGPHSDIARAALADTDARLGELLGTIDRRGVRDRTAVVVVADHGMEQNDPAVGGQWGDALTEAGVRFRDEASGFLYLGVDPEPLAPRAGLPLP